MLILSFVLARQKETLLHSGLLFACLLCFKHIFLYLAPAYFVFLLRAYCLDLNTRSLINFPHCMKLGSGIGIIGAVAFGPFVLFGQLDQLKSRLFPFSRGLCHAYWAPNVWALYSAIDRFLLLGQSPHLFLRASSDHLPAAPTLGLQIKSGAVQSGTRGIVGDTAFAVLPDILPITTFLLTLVVQLVSGRTSSRDWLLTSRSLL